MRVLLTVLALAGGVAAAAGASADDAKPNRIERGANKVGKGVEKTAKRVEKGVTRAVDKTKKGVERTVDRTEKGVKKLVE